MNAGEAGRSAGRVPRKPNSTLRGIRENERHETRAEFAEAMARLARETSGEVYPDENYVLRLESGRITWPHRTYRNILEKLCGRPARELGFAPLPRSADDSGETPSRANVRLREAVWESGMEVTEFARKIGVDPKTVERWITQGRIPQPFRRWKTSLILGIDESEIWPDATPSHEIPASRPKVADSRNFSGSEKASEIEISGQIVSLSDASDMNDMVEAVKRREFLLGMATTVGFGCGSSRVMQC